MIFHRRVISLIQPTKHTKPCTSPTEFLVTICADEWFFTSVNLSLLFRPFSLNRLQPVFVLQHWRVIGWSSILCRVI